MINILPSPIWQEQISASNERSYIAAPQPICPPNNSDTESPHGISIIEYNMDGSLVATRSESIPSTVWIWSAEAASAVSVLIHHAPIKRVEWHPLIADLLLIHCNLAEPVVHLWKSSWESPTIVNLFLDRLGGKIDATWLPNEAIGVPCMMLSNLHNYATAKISHHGKLIPWSGENERICSGPEDMFDEGNSLDISRMKNSQNEMTKETLGDSLGNGVTGQWVVSDEVDDTFQYRRPRV